MPTSTPVPVSLTIMLDELNGSGQSGSVILTNRGAQTEVVVSVTPGISALAHIHDGSYETLGGIVHDLSDTSGASSSMTVNATLDSLIAGSFAVNLHDDEDPSIYTSCGNVAEAGQSLTITLAEMTASGQSGWATLTNRGAQTEVVVSVTPGISALAHIHDGSYETLGGIVHDLSDTSGASSSMTVNATLDSLIAGSFAVNLHDDEDPSIYTSCGNVAEAGQSLTITLAEMTASGQSGWATLTNRGAQTEVVVSVTPGISALAHIHDGSCETLGGIVHDLSDTSGASSSMTVNATLDSLIAGSFAVNLHDDEDPSIYTSCGDI